MKMDEWWSAEHHKLIEKNSMRAQSIEEGHKNSHPLPSM